VREGGERAKRVLIFFFVSNATSIENTYTTSIKNKSGVALQKWTLLVNSTNDWHIAHTSTQTYHNIVLCAYLQTYPPIYIHTPSQLAYTTTWGRCSDQQLRQWCDKVMAGTAPAPCINTDTTVILIGGHIVHPIQNCVILLGETLKDDRLYSEISIWAGK